MEESRSFGYLCPHCKKPVLAQRTRFALSAAAVRIECACEKSELRAEKDRCQEPESFTDNVIMYEVLSELKDIAARGGVSCTCGCREYSIAVHRGSVDLICKNCGGKLRLPAATDEDLDRLCCQMKLVIHGV